MNNEELFFLSITMFLTYGGCGVLFIALGLPLYFKKIKPNKWYGFRAQFADFEVQKKLQKEEIWYEVNKYTGKYYILIGIVLFILSTILFFFNKADFTFIGMTFILLLLVIFSTMKIHKYFKKILRKYDNEKKN